MTLKEQLNKDYINYMKEKQTLAKNAIQLIRSNIASVEKDNKSEITDESIVIIIQSHIKRLKESREFAVQGNREDIIKECDKSIIILEKYLPKQLTDEELVDKIKYIISMMEFDPNTGDVIKLTIKDMGKIIKQCKDEMGSSVTGERIANEVKKQLLSK